MPDWRTETYPSGTVVVTRSDKTKPHLHVKGNVARIDHHDSARHETAKLIEQFLNGETKQLPVMTRTGPQALTMQSGFQVIATGPMVDVSPPGQWGNWKQDDGDDAKIARWELIESLLTNREHHA